MHLPLAHWIEIPNSVSLRTVSTHSKKDKIFTSSFLQNPPVTVQPCTKLDDPSRSCGLNSAEILPKVALTSVDYIWLKISQKRTLTDEI